MPAQRVAKDPLIMCWPFLARQNVYKEEIEVVDCQDVLREEVLTILIPRLFFYRNAYSDIGTVERANIIVKV